MIQLPSRSNNNHQIIPTLSLRHTQILLIHIFHKTETIPCQNELSLHLK